MEFQELAGTVGEGMELGGIAVMVVGIAVSLVAPSTRWILRRRGGDVYQQTRRHIGRSILLGLELLVAGDIIRTVAVDPTFTSVGVLAGVVAIRTFLSFTLELEISGRWPWQQDPDG